VVAIAVVDSNTAVDYFALYCQ